MTGPGGRPVSAAARAGPSPLIMRGSIGLIVAGPGRGLEPEPELQPEQGQVARGLERELGLALAAAVALGRDGNSRRKQAMTFWGSGLDALKRRPRGRR